MHEPTLHFLLPFSLPGATEGAAVLNARATPALDTIVRYASQSERIVGEDFQRSLSHERWVASQYGIVSAHGGKDGDASGQTGDLPLAPYMALADGLTPGETRWACLQPVHVEVTHDHLVLIDPDALALSDSDAADLFVEAKASADALGMTLLAPTPRRWYLGGDALGRLVGASPLRATGRSIEIWLPYEAVPATDAEPVRRSSRTHSTPPTPKRSRAWMKLQNEIQMAWHDHPVNTSREARRQLATNSVWFHGQGVLASANTLARPFREVYSDAAATRGLALAVGDEAKSLPKRLADLWQAASSAPADQARSDAPLLLEIGALSQPFLAQDWGSWLPTLADIDANWLAPALQALQDGTVKALSLTLCSDTGSVTLSLRRFDLKKFWRRHSLLSLLTD